LPLTEKQVKEYREKLRDSEYVEKAIGGVAEKFLTGSAIEPTYAEPETNDTEEKEMARNSLYDLYDREFGFAISAKAMGGVLKNHGLKNGRDGRFRPGQVPPNKGRKGYCSPGSEKGWFEPGNMPFNTMPLGSERVNAYGYVEVKYSEKSGPPKNRWKGKHVLAWEKANGPVPEGHAVIFADGDRRNFKLKNLVLVSRKELAVLNRAGMLGSKNEGIAKVSVGIARLQVLLADRKRGTLETRSNKKLVVIDNRGSRIVIMRDRKTGRYFPARETKHGPRRLKAPLKPRETLKEARRDLTAYALKRGWRRV
jgi:hypothetical protein